MWKSNIQNWSYVFFAMCHWNSVHLFHLSIFSVTPASYVLPNPLIYFDLCEIFKIILNGTWIRCEQRIFDHGLPCGIGMLTSNTIDTVCWQSSKFKVFDQVQYTSHLYQIVKKKSSNFVAASCNVQTTLACTRID